KADLEARRLMKTFARASQAIDENPAGVYEQLRQRPDVPQRELEEFGRLLSVRTLDRKSTRLNSSHGSISYAVFCLKKKQYAPQQASQLLSPRARQPRTYS